MVVAAAAPLTIMISTPLNMLASNGAGISFDYFIGPLLLLVFAGGYAAMSMKVKKAGAFYSYVTAGLGRPVGVGSGFMAVFGYLAFQAFVYLLMGFTMNSTLAAFGSAFNLEWWAWSIISIALVAVLGYLNIDLSAKVLSVALILEVLVIVIIDIAILAQGGGPEGISVTSIYTPEVILNGSLPLGIMFGLSIGLGFEATAIFRDEARNPERTIPRAIYISIISAAVFYGLATWVLIQGFGPSTVMETIGGLDDPTAAIFIAAGQYVGPVFVQIMSVLAVTSMFACVLSYHNIGSRYIHSLGHSVLPVRLTAVHPKFHSPYVASMWTSVIAVVLFVLALISGVDTFAFMQWEIAIATLSFLILLVLTSVAIFIFFRRNRNLGVGLWSSVLSPVISFVIFVVVLVTALANFGTLSMSDPATNVVLQLVPVALLLAGVAAALIAKKLNPARYEGLREHGQATPTEPVSFQQ
jgi:amino acid transporter